MHFGLAQFRALACNVHHVPSNIATYIPRVVIPRTIIEGDVCTDKFSIQEPDDHWPRDTARISSGGNKRFLQARSRGFIRV